MCQKLGEVGRRVLYPICRTPAVYGEYDRCESRPDEPLNERLYEVRRIRFVAAECRDMLQACDALYSHRRRLSTAYGRVVGTLKGTEPGVGARFPDEE